MQFFAPQSHPIVIDAGSALIKVAYRGKLLWQQPTVVAVDRQTQTAITIGKLASEQLSVSSGGQLQAVFPVHAGRVANFALLEYYFNTLLSQLVWVDGSSVSRQTPITLILSSALSLVHRQEWAHTIRQLGRKVHLHSESEVVRLCFPEREASFWVIDFGQNHTQCTLFGPDAYCESRSFPWGVNRLLTALSRAIQQEGIAISEQQLTTILKEVVTIRLEHQSPKKRRMAVVAKQLQTSSLSQLLIREEVIEREVETVLQQWLWTVSQYLRDLARGAEWANQVGICYLTGGGAGIHGLLAVMEQELFAGQTKIQPIQSWTTLLSEYYEKT